VNTRLANVTVALAAVTAFVLAGCSPTEDPDSGPAMPKPVSFEGKVDPALVGNWSTKDLHSVITLFKGGEALILAVAKTPGGEAKSQYAGQWLSTPNDLLLKYSVPGQGDTTVKYGYKLADGKLTLTSGIGTKTEYQIK